MAHCQPFLKMSCKSVQKFLRKVANEQRDKQRRLHNLLGGGNETLSRYKSGDIEDVCDCIEELYYDIVNTLVACAKNVVSVRRKCYERNFGRMRD